MAAAIIRTFTLVLLLVAAGLGPVSAAETFRTDRLTIETASGGKYPFAIEVAETPRQMAQGLMFRETMAPDAGMLFVLPQLQTMSMWMKNTFIPLDMVFIGADGRIVNIHENAVPQSLDTISSAGQVKGVLEINGGMAARLGIRAGDRVVHPAFQQQG
ncbi:DUF192 domain-containing protein [Skermanella sp. TT6]|uniref:DUF192 domain-containing protein n=1 Tax=Skermanella cutis TaxID=2775420 RepID=A0ABX7B1H4_9PROT|nr:DUF192 domain-containing protein [Skermanella sp. TT6]QQP88175.1 DUF192 domain-containing protein [Skermanella sp. TT6]